MRRAWPLLLPLALAAAGCGSRTAAPTTVAHVRGVHVKHCTAGSLLPLGSAVTSYAGLAEHGAVAYRRPGGPELTRFGRVNVNGFPTVFGVIGAVVGRDCKPRWFHVQLPLRPNGVTGYVRAAALELRPLHVSIRVEVGRRRLTLYRWGRPVLTATVAVGSPSTPTPTGRFYVNQRLIPEDPAGPFGPGAIGVSAFSNVLTGWTQGGPIAIHGTDAPWSIGQAVSNGCIRLPNDTLTRLFSVALAGTPVIIVA